MIGLGNLFAKRGNETDFGVRLQGHLLQVKDVAQVMSLPGILRRTGLDEQYIEELSKALPLVAILHDLGKANPFFQKMIQTGIASKQPVRHEVVSDWILRQHEGIRLAVLRYLNLQEMAHPERDWRFVSLRVAILGHHLKFPNQHNGPTEEIQVLTEHPDFITSVKLLENLTGETIQPMIIPPLISEVRWLKGNILDDYRDALKESGLYEEVANEKGKFASFLRSFLLAADSLGSVASMTKEDWHHSLKQIEESIQGIDLSKELPLLIEERLKGIIPDPEVTDFQRRVGESKASVTIVEAGCGSGKTIASYRWGVNQHATNLFLAYPTTATATQGYLDYGLLAPEMSRLLHSRASVDMELLSNGEEENEADLLSMSNALERIQKPFVLCTVDTILGVMENYRSSAILFPKLLNSVVIFDEAHSYDEPLFQHLLHFLKNVPVPTLIMSASLQNDRKKMIREALEEVDRSIEWVKGPQSYEERMRYRITVKDRLYEEAIWPALREGKKVLVIANQVEVARAYYEMLKEQAARMGITSEWFLYHSRFEYQDRLDRQRDIINHFRSEGATCAVTTQIAEFSFDISADLLISEIADFPSIIQRLGRLNRYAQEGDSVGQAYFFMPSDPKPYQDQELKESASLLIQLEGRNISQIDLADKLAQLSEKEMKKPSVYDWAKLYKSQAVQSIRKPGYSISCLRDMHYDPAHQLAWQEYQKYLLPMPTYQLPKGVERIRSAYLIPEEKIEYTKEKGGRWK